MVAYRTRWTEGSDCNRFTEHAQKSWTSKLCREWADLLMHSRIDQLTWIYCPGHAGVQGNEQADRLASGASIQCVHRWDKSDLLMSGRDASNREEMLAWENDPHIIRLREQRVKQGEGRTSTLSWRHLIAHSQVDSGTVDWVELISIHTPRWLLEREGSAYGNVLTAIILPQITQTY
jgi:hypothetical protein